MIPLEAKDLNKKGEDKKPEGNGFPVGWAVRSFEPDVLADLNRMGEDAFKADAKNKNKTFAPLVNEMNILPVYRSDFEVFESAKVKVAGEKEEVRPKRTYYIFNDDSARLRAPEPLKKQVTGTAESKTGPKHSGKTVKGLDYNQQKGTATAKDVFAPTS